MGLERRDQLLPCEDGVVDLQRIVLGNITFNDARCNNLSRKRKHPQSVEPHYDKSEQP